MVLLICLVMYIFMPKSKHSLSYFRPMQWVCLVVSQSVDQLPLSFSHQTFQTFLPWKKLILYLPTSCLHCNHIGTRQRIYTVIFESISQDESYYGEYIINRPGVAKAVIQRASWLIHWFVEWVILFLQILLSIRPWCSGSTRVTSVT